MTDVGPIPRLKLMKRVRLCSYYRYEEDNAVSGFTIFLHHFGLHAEIGRCRWEYPISTAVLRALCA